MVIIIIKYISAKLNKEQKKKKKIAWISQGTHTDTQKEKKKKIQGYTLISHLLKINFTRQFLLFNLKK